MRFSFGKNWLDFKSELNDEQIDHATDSLCLLLETNNMSGLSFLDIGSGSGLMGLAANRLGASVYSFDYDEDSVKCTKELKDQFNKKITGL